MENNAGLRLEYWISVDPLHQKSLFDLRKWSHLKIAYEEDLIWIRGFTNNEISSVKVLKIPSAKKYYIKNTQLYLLGNRLPNMVEPSLLWTDIQRGLTLSLPTQNFNYFGLEQKYSIAIVPTEITYKINVSLVKLEALYAFVKSAAQIRMSPLLWTIIDDTQAMIIGDPLLPMNGEDYYCHGCFIIPGGWKLKYENMLDIYGASLSNSSSYWFVINEKNKIQKIKKSKFVNLNKASVVQSYNLINQLKVTM